jgi:hypothetical protein
MKSGRIIAVALTAIVACGGSWLLHLYFSNSPTPAPSSESKGHGPALRHISHQSGRDSDEPPAETDQLTRGEIDAYLAQNNRSAMSLLAAYLLLRDTSFLKEASTKYPKDPRVELTILDANLFPEDRVQWLKAFKENATDNALANYLSALDLFRAGQTESAIGESVQGGRKSVLDTYWPDLANAVAEAYISAGFPPEDANFMGNTTVGISRYAEELRGLCTSLSNEAFQHQQNGDIAGANTLFMLVLEIGSQLASGTTGKLLSNEVAGDEIQSGILGHIVGSETINLNGTAASGDERAEALWARRNYIDQLIDSVPLDELILSHALSKDDLLEVSKRVRTQGEVSAMEWLRDKLGPNLPPQPSASERK